MKPILSIEECRELISDSNKMTDEDVAALRADLYEMTELALEYYFARAGQKNNDDQ